jgi:transcriptional regulator with XRE-family HTH domain
MSIKTPNVAPKNISPEQCRAARALLGWSQADLSGKARVAKQTLVDFERGARTPYDRTLADIERALREGGAVFIPENGGGPGVRLAKASKRKPKPLNH